MSAINKTFEAPRFDDDAIPFIANQPSQRLDAVSEYKILRQSYEDLRRRGDYEDAAALAGEAARFLHSLARAGLLAVPRVESLIAQNPAA